MGKGIVIDKEKELEFEEYVKLEGSEIGEACYALLQLAKYPDYVSEEFQLAIEKEIDVMLEMFKEETRIVEREETYTRKVVELEWK